MKFIKFTLLVELFVLSTVFGGETKDAAVTFFYSSNRQGELETCGCQTSQLGGIDRFHTVWEREKAAPEKPEVWLLDAGDTFFARPEILPQRREQEVLKAMTIANAYRVFRNVILVPGERDFADGIETLKKLERESEAKFIAANLTDEKEKPLFSENAFLDLGTRKIGIVGLVDPEAFVHVSGVRVRPPEVVIDKAIQNLKAKGANLIVVLSHLGLAKDREIAKHEGVSLIVGAHSMDPLRNGERVSNALIVQPLHDGQQMGRIRVPPGSRVELDHLVIDMDDSLRGPGPIRSIIDEYKKRTEKAAVRDAGKSVVMSDQKNHFVGNPFYCKNCHEKQFGFWSETKHSIAYLTLYSKTQHFDPECIHCHTLGFENGGFNRISRPIEVTSSKTKGEPFIKGLMKKVFEDEKVLVPLDSSSTHERIDKLRKRYFTEMSHLSQSGQLTKLFLGVQCEHCHGNRTGHPEKKTGMLKKVSTSACLTCHIPPHDDRFSASKVVKIACPKRN